MIDGEQDPPLCRRQPGVSSSCQPRKLNLWAGKDKPPHQARVTSAINYCCGHPGKPSTGTHGTHGRAGGAAGAVSCWDTGTSEMDDWVCSLLLLMMSI